MKTIKWYKSSCRLRFVSLAAHYNEKWMQFFPLKTVSLFGSKSATLISGKTYPFKYDFNSNKKRKNYANL